MNYTKNKKNGDERKNSSLRSNKKDSKENSNIDSIINNSPKGDKENFNEQNINEEDNENNEAEQLRKVFKKHLPKNVNQYRHIIDTMQSRDSDVEWVLELRAYNPKQNYETLREHPGYYPDVYRNSFNDYKEKVEKEIKEKRENKLRFKGNSRDFEHVMKRRIGMPANPTQLGFDSTLRSMESDKTTFKNAPWNTLAISPRKNLLSTFLPPMKNSSKENLLKIGEYVTRPYEQIEDQSSVGGNKIRRRNFIPSQSLTLKFDGEHNSSPNYSLKYTQKNVNSIRHLLDQQINSLGKWESDLRSYNVKVDNRNEYLTAENLNINKKLYKK